MAAFIPIGLSLASRWLGNRNQQPQADQARMSWELERYRRRDDVENRRARASLVGAMFSKLGRGGELGELGGMDFMKYITGGGDLGEMPMGRRQSGFSAALGGALEGASQYFGSRPSLPSTGVTGGLNLDRFITTGGIRGSGGDINPIATPMSRSEMTPVDDDEWAV